MGIQVGLTSEWESPEGVCGSPTEEAGDYNLLKSAILRRYDITDESYRQRFRGAKLNKEESNRELVVRLQPSGFSQRSHGKKYWTKSSLSSF